MKLSVLLLLAIQLVSIKGLIVDTSEELICPDPENPLDCYPKIFIPTEEWQVIKEGQEIPPGLHVRLNIDTLEKEAKLMDAEAKDEVPVQELVVDGELQDHSKEAIQENLQKIHEKKHPEVKQDHSHRSKVNKDDLNNFDSASLEVENYKPGESDIERLNTALDTLEELSHDIEFGEKLTADKNIFQSLLRIADTVNDAKVEEKAYRIMGSSLRNNPEAINNLLANFDSDFVGNLFSQLAAKDDILQKRILGIIQALSQNGHFTREYFSFDHSSGLDNLIEIFPQLGSESQARASNILEDLQLFPVTNDRRSLEDQNPESRVSKFIQNSFVSNKLDENNFKPYFNQLAKLHEGNKDLKPTNDFLAWLAEEAELRKENKKRDDYSRADKDFDEFMLRARHEVFGNPMGMRKAIADEL
ncbi:Nucleotide exchange factor SIL1 [Candida viswanathii]|uniref:Nucleotide exchange factor SIL1 n=1 Tax=Candida viswanathii TaxID=5486 RepID=A0A367YKD8_9ASCO|nr:Nucleotide exchange factor SIL1 [Candida viswanathii]